MSPNPRPDSRADEPMEFHAARDFFPTLRQGEFFKALLSAPYPLVNDDQDAGLPPPALW